MQEDKNRKDIYSIARIVAGTVHHINLFKHRKLSLKKRRFFFFQRVASLLTNTVILYHNYIFCLFSWIIASRGIVFRSCYSRFQDHSLTNVQLRKPILPGVMKFSPLMNDVGWNCPTCGAQRMETRILLAC